MKANVSLSILAGIFLFAACERGSEDKPEMKIIQLSPQEKSMVQAGNGFALNLFAAVNREENQKDRIFISPYSVAEALSMTYNGARGSTADSMQKVLGYSGMSREEINNYCLSLRTTLLRLDPKVNLAIANSIWYLTGFDVLPDFIQTNQKYFNAKVAELDFYNPSALTTINGWIEESTNGRIKDMLKEIEPNIVMFLVDAIWFKGQWLNRFQASKTLEENFYLSGGEPVKTPMMHQTQNFLYYSNNLVQIADLPYGQGNFAMTVLLPKDGVRLEEFKSELSQENWNNWINNLYEQKLVLTLPKLKFAYDLRMNAVLQQMGMGNAFSEMEADFTGINPDGGLFISYVQHNSFVEVNEEGTEAAAATVVAIGKTSAGPPEEIPFIVNKPYIFVIRERSTGAILFMGTINKPAI
jgi:serine protease inhibitor